ncbi:MAG: hypothetical protein IPP07_16765 [Holophagales bacterium]|nr:hypothetical protein [Holophagales bacterium]
MAVPPIGFRPATKASARSTFASDGATSLPNSGSVSVEKRTTSNRSPSPRFFRQNASAFFACASFFPSAIEPDVSRTKTTSFFTIFSAAISCAGDRTRRKLPSASPGSRYAMTWTETSEAVAGATKSWKSVSGLTSFASKPTTAFFGPWRVTSTSWLGE